MIPIVDSTVLIDWLRGRPKAKALLSGAVERNDVVLGSVLSRTEIGAGMRGGERSIVEALFTVLEWTPVTTRIADVAGEYSREYRHSHSHIGAVDYLIAATASVLDARLLTHNVRHFPMFPGLKAPY